MSRKHVKGEMHGCIVCGKLYELYVVYSSEGSFVDARVMSAGGRSVPGAERPLVACERHTEAEIRRAVDRTYGRSNSVEDD